MDAAQRNEAVFGAFDGTTSIIGLAFGLTMNHYPAAAVAIAGASAAISASVSMGGGSYESADVGTPLKRKLSLAGIMVLATLVGSLIPIAPFFIFSSHVALIIGGVLALTVAGWIGHQKHSQPGAGGYTLAIGMMVLAAALATVFAVLVPAGAG